MWIRPPTGRMGHLSPLDQRREVLQPSRAMDIILNTCVWWWVVHVCQSVFCTRGARVCEDGSKKEEEG